MSILPDKYKKSFRVMLTSTQANSFSGIQFNANFPVNLASQVDSSDLDKPYKVEFAFKSESAFSSINTLSMGTLYALYLNFQSQTPSSIQYTNMGNCAGILSLLNDFTGYSTTAGVTTTSIYFDTKPTDNAPIILNKLRNISNINLNVVNLLDNATFNSTNNTTINSYTDYICILTFTQI